MHNLEELLFDNFQDARDREYDFIVIGAGATGTAVTREIATVCPDARTLVLDQGAYLLPGHVQNVGSVYQPLMDTAVATPWRSGGELELVGQVPYLGGRTLFWSGAAPTPSAYQLRHWPAQIVEELEPIWPAARGLVGVRRASAVAQEYNSLNAQIRNRVYTRIKDIPGVHVPQQSEDLDAPLGMPKLGNLGTATKYSALPNLLETHGSHPSTVTIVPKCPVLQLTHDGDSVTAIETSSGPLQAGRAKIVLAMGTAENTSLVLKSFPRDIVPMAGHNLSGNAANFFMCRLPRAEFENLSADSAELSALYLDAHSGDRELVLHLSASATADPGRDRETIFRLLPDVFGDGVIDRLSDPDHVVFLVNGVAELAGEQTPSSPSRIYLDERGQSVIQYSPSHEDEMAVDSLGDMIREVLNIVAAGRKLEYWSPENRCWERTPPRQRRLPFAMLESGTLWMGNSPDSSVTDTNGRLHNVENTYVTGGALFPTRGSWNPLLTMTALAMRLGRHLTS